MEPSSISSTSSTPRSGYRLVDPLSPVQSDAEAGPHDAAAAGRLSQQDLAEMQRDRAQALEEQASFLANQRRSAVLELEQERAKRVDHEQPSDNSGGEQEGQRGEQDPEHDPYRISDDEMDRPARDRTLAGRYSPLEGEEQDEGQEEQDREREEAEEIWPYSQSSED